MYDVTRNKIVFQIPQYSVKKALSKSVCFSLIVQFDADDLSLGWRFH